MNSKITTTFINWQSNPWLEMELKLQWTASVFQYQKQTRVMTSKVANICNFHYINVDQINIWLIQLRSFYLIIKKSLLTLIQNISYLERKTWLCWWERGGTDMPFNLSNLWEERVKGTISLFKLWNIKETSEMFSLKILPKIWFTGHLMLKHIQ